MTLNDGRKLAYYLAILNTGFRRGDAAKMLQINPSTAGKWGIEFGVFPAKGYSKPIITEHELREEVERLISQADAELTQATPRELLTQPT